MVENSPTPIHAPGPSEDPLALPPPPPTDYTAAGVPNLDYVRDRIEGRLARAEGGTELAAAGDEARAAVDQAQAREKAAAERLAAIRRSLHPDGG